jgi:hypothetical protein
MCHFMTAVPVRREEAGATKFNIHRGANLVRAEAGGCSTTGRSSLSTIADQGGGVLRLSDALRESGRARGPGPA